MLILISPAKSLDFETKASTEEYTCCEFLEDSELLNQELLKLSPQDLAGLMKISDKLAALGIARISSWQQPFDLSNAKQALFAFRGAVYTALDADSLSAKQLSFAQQHLRMLSGLYGLLKPFDLIQAYRLEMGTRLENTRGSNLYKFWGNLITAKLNHQLSDAGSDCIVNLASVEYSKSVQHKNINGRWITPVFKEFKGDKYKVIAIHAKHARGLMCRYIIDNEIECAEEIQGFDSEGYRYMPSMSTDLEWVFVRD